MALRHCMVYSLVSTKHSATPRSDARLTHAPPGHPQNTRDPPTRAARTSHPPRHGRLHGVAADRRPDARETGEGARVQEEGLSHLGLTVTGGPMDGILVVCGGCV